MNPLHWGDRSEETLRSLMANPVVGLEDETELGAGIYIFHEYRGIFETNGVKTYEDIEDSTVRLLMKASQINKDEPKLPRVDLYAKVLQSLDLVISNELPGVIFFEIYLTQKVSNGVCESFGKIGNLYREGVRRKMGILYLEASIRLHFLSPLEKANK